MLASVKLSSLLGPFVSYEENEGLWIRPQGVQMIVGRVANASRDAFILKDFLNMVLFH